MTQRLSKSPPKSVVPPTVAPASTATFPGGRAPHELECLIQRRLQGYSGLRFARLTVHKCDQGVCLEGLLEANDEGFDLCELVDQIAGVKAINRVVQRTQPK